MRDTVDTNSRTAFLSTLCEPQINLTLRQLRLDFGGTPLVESDYNVILSGEYVGDDFYGHLPWGDSCITETSEYMVRIVNKAAWGAASDYLASWTTDGDEASDWDLTDIANVSGGTDPECYANTRIGLYPKATSDAVYVWYADTSGNICRVEWLCTTQTWSSITSAAFDVGDPESMAIHPISESSAFVVWVEDNGVYIQLITWGGASWSSDAAQLVWRSSDIEPADVLYSDAELISGTEYLLLLTLAHHGAVYAVRYDTATDILTQPLEIAGSNAEWTTQRAYVTGLSKENSRMWAVVQRAMVSSDETPQAQHTALISSADGIHWRTEDFVGLPPCYGKLLYQTADSYCYVVGNAVVYKADATYKLGTDVAAMKRTIDEGSAFTFTCPGLNVAHSLSLRGVNIDGDIVTDDRIADGSELELELREAGESYTTMAKLYLQRVEAADAFGKAPFKITARGPISKLSGDASWQHPTGKQYDSPSFYYSNFNFEETGAARISAAQKTGIWATVKDPDYGVYHLEGKTGHAVIPRTFGTPWLTLASHFCFKNSVEVGGIIFFWQDEENYWRVGVRRTASDLAARLVMEKVVDGEVTELDSADPTSWTDLYPTNEGLTKEISLYLDITPSQVRAIFLVDAASDDFSDAGAVTLTYDPSAETDPVEFPYHVGYEMEDWIDLSGGINSGSEIQVTDFGDSWIKANVILSGVVGKQINIGDRWYTIKWTTSDRYYVFPNLRAEPEIGSAVGIYEFSDNSKIVVRDIAVCDGRPAWTVDDVATDLMEMGGITREPVPITAYHLGHASAAVFYDIDMRVTTAAPKMVIHASKKTSYSGWLVEVAASWTTLKKYDEGTPTTVAIYPNMLTLSALSSTEIRFIWRDNQVYIYAGDHFLCSFWDVRTSGSGYSGPPDTVNATTTEFPRLQESFILDAGRPVSGALARLLRGRPARMLERQDGRVLLSKFETHEDLGTWSSSVVATVDGIKPTPSLIETEGADVRQYYLEKETARRALRYRRARNESAEGELSTLRDAARVARLSREKSDTYVSKMLPPDIAAEVEDQVTIGGTDYIIESYGVSHNRGKAKKPLRWRTEYKLREAMPDPTTGMWHTGSDSSEWGSVQWG